MKHNYSLFRRNRWLWLLALLMLMPIGSWAQNETNYELVFVKADNTEIATPITDEYPVISSDVRWVWVVDHVETIANWVINTSQPEPDNQIIIPIGGFKKMYAREVGNTGISSLGQIDGLTSTGIYTLEGVMVSKDETSLQELPKGIYLIKKANHKTIKIVKR